MTAATRLRDLPPPRDRAPGFRAGWRGLAVTTVLAVLVALLLVTGVRWLGHRSSASIPVAPTNAALEAKWGVRFTQVGMSADGGMVDVRYLILDENRAGALAQTIPATPVLIDEKSGRVVFAVAMKAHAHDLHTGGRYYLLYRNTRGLLHAGSTVSIKLGDLKLEHMTVLGTSRS